MTEASLGPTARTVVITGAGSGIGAAAARQFARTGAHVLLGDINVQRLEKVQRELVDEGFQATAATVDVRSRSSVDSFVARGVAVFERKFDVLCPNAGIVFPEAPLEDMTDEQFDALIDVNLRGVFFVLRAALPHLEDGGSIILTSSISGLMAHPGDAVYAATKIAVIGLGRSLALEVNQRRIRVNMICPGGVETPLTLGAYGDQAASVIEGYALANPLGRIAQPEDIAEAMVFLASGAARHINGVALRVDGGDCLVGAL